jgi:hypothetical protein
MAVRSGVTKVCRKAMQTGEWNERYNDNIQIADEREVANCSETLVTTYRTSNKKKFLHFNPAKTKTLHATFARKKTGRDYKVGSFLY